LAREARIDRILTSGGSGAWPERLARIVALREAAPAGLRILPGGGLDGDAIHSLAAAGFTEAHVGTVARVPPDARGRVSASRVAALVARTISASPADPS